MSKIPFKVSARTARLIGRENIASSKGAIIELVKNGYDADSKVSIVFFDNRYSEIPVEVSKNEFFTIIDQVDPSEKIVDYYDEGEETYKLKDNISDDDKILLRNILNACNTLYIIDTGDGMTQSIIVDFWMTIGTDNKAHEIVTNSGRVKTGAKGIGRFALDKLGSKCEMITIFNPSVHKTSVNEEVSTSNYTGYFWTVNWDDFESENATIDKVDAELIGLNETSIFDAIRDNVIGLELDKVSPPITSNYGTILKITGLRDNWEDFYIDELYSDLEVLIPPREESDFQIFLFSTLNPSKYGEIKGSLCDDYDYKVVAKADSNQQIEIEIFRNEYDIDTIDPGIFKKEAFLEFPYRKEDFVKGSWKTKSSFSKLIPGFKEKDEENTFEKIGKFEFVFYFMKRTFATPDLKKFFYKRFSSNERKDWLNKYGGIKLFRDEFRVRPYGEKNNASFDWLGLGGRKAKSPAAVSKKSGGYKVEPENITGVISISRLSNLNFEDKSSREGVQENKAFQIFKRLIEGIIDIFEQDRAYIAREMLIFHDDKFSDVMNREKAQKLAESILAQKEKERTPQADDNSDYVKDEIDTSIGEGVNDKNKLYILAELIKEKDDTIGQLEDEQKVLRGMASSGIVIASFTHELGHLNDLLGTRFDDLKYLIKDAIPEGTFLNKPDFLNPYVLIESFHRQDLKMQNWLKFALGAARKDKRKRTQTNLLKYFEGLKATWYSVLKNRETELIINHPPNSDLAFRVFEIDLDSIFNNLVVNSIEAFLLHTKIVDRKIEISYFENEKEIIVEYFDNGPGLSQDIVNPERIFDALFTTKRNRHTGEEEGTGLGMWLLSSIVKDNDGEKNLLFTSEGFGIRISFPKKY